MATTKTNKRDFFKEILTTALTGLTAYDSTVKITDEYKLEPHPSVFITILDETIEPESSDEYGLTRSRSGVCDFIIDFNAPAQKKQNMNLVLDSINNRWADLLQSNVEHYRDYDEFTYTDSVKTISYKLYVTDVLITSILTANDTAETPRALLRLIGRIKYVQTNV